MPVWAGAKVSTKNQTLDAALDLKSGETVSRVTERAPAGGHTRCYRNKATERYLVLGGVGVEFIHASQEFHAAIGRIMQAFLGITS